MSNCTKQGDTLECAVCLQTCVHPAQLPCGHIFCYLCVKGFANQNKRCAMCRQEIPRDFIEQPRLLNSCSCVESGEGFDGDFRWYYEGRNGWWLYDERTSKELELSYKKGEKNIEILIAGFLYIIDFENMLQLRRNDPSRRRQIKRDHASQPVKGVAGLRADPPPQQSSDPEPSNNSCPHIDGEPSTPAPTNSHNATSATDQQCAGNHNNGPSTFQTPQCEHVVSTSRDRIAPLRANVHSGSQIRSGNQESPGTSESSVARFVVEHMGSLRLEDDDLTVSEPSRHSKV